MTHDEIIAEMERWLETVPAEEPAVFMLIHMREVFRREEETVKDAAVETVSDRIAAMYNSWKNDDPARPLSPDELSIVAYGGHLTDAQKTLLCAKTKKQKE